MQPKGLKQLNEQLTALSFAYDQLSKAYFNFREAEAKWPAGLTKYLRDEAEIGPKTPTEMRDLANRMCYMRAEVSELRANAAQLAYELQRVGSGESFSV